MLVGMEVLMGVVAAVGTWYQRDVSRRREAQFQLEKLEVATKHSRTWGKGTVVMIRN
jgi:hypothetical protein